MTRAGSGLDAATLAALVPDGDITRARTPPPRVYLDAALFEASAEAVFARSWQWLGPCPEVHAPGWIAPRTLLEGWRDEPLLLSRDAGGTLRVLANVCTHRGMVMVDAPCRAEHIRCPYHARRFELDGRLRHMPGFEGVQGFPSAADHLLAYRLETWAGHRFVALDGHGLPALAEWLAPVTQRLPWLPVEAFVHDAAGERRFEFEAHWALYVENYLEGLHIPFVHPGLQQTYAAGSYRYELFEHGNLQWALARDDEPAFEPPPGAPHHGQRVAAFYFWFFPNLMLNFYPWGLSLNLVEPLAPGRTRVRFVPFVHQPALRAGGSGGALDRVEQEDEAAVLGVARGMRSRGFRGGRYSPGHERGTHQFHRLLGQALQGALGGTAP